jgi:hypothetical protein
MDYFSQKLRELSKKNTELPGASKVKAGVSSQIKPSVTKPTYYGVARSFAGPTVNRLSDKTNIPFKMKSFQDPIVNRLYESSKTTYSQRASEFQKPLLQQAREFPSDVKKYVAPKSFVREIPEVTKTVSSKIKEFLIPKRGYTEQQLKETQPTIKESAVGAARTASEILGGMGRLGMIIGEKLKSPSKEEKDKAEKIVSWLEEKGKPKTAGEAKAMRFADILGVAPIGAVTKASKLKIGKIKDALKIAETTEDVGKIEGKTGLKFTPTERKILSLTKEDNIIKTIVDDKITDKSVEGIKPPVSEQTPLKTQPRANESDLIKEVRNKSEDKTKISKPKVISQESTEKLKQYLSAKPEERLLLEEHKPTFTSVKEAKQYFKKTGEVPEFTNVLKEGKPMLMAEKGGEMKRLKVKFKDNNEATKIWIKENLENKGYDYSRNTFGKVRKLITSGQKILQKSGEGGQRMANLIEKQRIDKDKMVGAFNKSVDDSLRGLNRKELFNLTDVLEGTGKSISDNVSKASENVRKILDIVAEKAKKEGFEIRLKSGKRVPFSKMEHYFPRIYDFNKLQKAKHREKAIEHLVNTGQFRNKAEAENALENFILDNAERRAGNLENTRSLDLPGYEKDPRIAIKKYLESVSGRFTEAENFGKKDEVISDLINKISKDGFDYRESQRIFDLLYRGEPKNKIVDAYNAYQVATKMSLSFIMNTSQILNTIATYGTYNTLKAATLLGGEKMANIIKVSKSRKYQDIVKMSNVFDDPIMFKEAGIRGGKIVRGIMFPFRKVEEGLRSVSSVAGTLRAKSLEERIAKYGTEGIIGRHASRKLKDLGIDPNKLLKGNLTQDDLITAANRASEKTQFKVDAFNLPPSWRTPTGRAVTFLKSFLYLNTKFGRDEILKEIKHGNLAPFARYIIGSAIISPFIMDLANKIRGREKEEEKGGIDIRDLDKYTKAISSFFTEPIVQGDFLKKTWQSNYLSTTEKVGRTASTALVGLSDPVNLAASIEYYDKIRRENEERRSSIAKGKVEEKDPLLKLKRLASEKIPFVGSQIKNKAFGFPKSNKSEPEKELTRKMYEFDKELREKYESGSKEEKQAIQKYINELPVDKRESHKYSLQQLGIDVEGITTSEDIIRMQPVYDKIIRLRDTGMKNEAIKEIEGLSDEDYDALIKVSNREKELKVLEGLNEEEKELYKKSNKEKAEVIGEEFYKVINDKEKKKELVKKYDKFNLSQDTLDKIFDYIDMRKSGDITDEEVKKVSLGDTKTAFVSLLSKAKKKKEKELLKPIEYNSKSLNNIENGIVSGYNIKSYATDPTHESKIGSIVAKIPKIKNHKQTQRYINSKAKDSPVTGKMIIRAANKYKVDPRMILAIIQQDSSIGTVGRAVRTKNPGNVGNTDSGATRYYGSWKEGVEAVAEWLKKHEL